ncbi:MFS transporter [Pyrobaculum sp.]|uniref:MFS transporter n=1 Tax=Pyrobaculum sp. TaxID=2004705 RepID=UPI003D09A03E
MRQGSSRAEGRGVPPAGLPELYTALFMLYFAPAHLVPVLPPYLEAMGLGPAAVGAVVGALGAARAPVVLVAGPLAEALGRRTALALGAAAAAAGALTLLTKDLPLILAGRVAAGVFGALAAPAIWSLISEAGGGRGRAISIANAVTATAGVAAPAAGGYTAAVFGYEAAVAASALLTLSVIPLSRAAPPDPRRPLGEALRMLPAAARGGGRYAAVFALEWYMLYSLLALLPLYVKRLGYGEEVAGQLLAFEALVYAARQPLVGYVIDRHRRHTP